MTRLFAFVLNVMSYKRADRKSKTSFFFNQDFFSFPREFEILTEDADWQSVTPRFA